MAAAGVSDYYSFWYWSRREARSLVMIRADFNQYYGDVSGRIRLGDRAWQVRDLFAVTEDSWLEL